MLERDWLELSLGAAWAATVNQPNQPDRLSGPRFRSGSEENEIVLLRNHELFEHWPISVTCQRRVEVPVDAVLLCTRSYHRRRSVPEIALQEWRQVH